MTNPIFSRISSTPHPRFTLLLLGGVIAFAVAGILYVADPVVPGPSVRTAFRVAIVGYLLTLFGGSGYIAFAISNRLSEW